MVVGADRAWGSSEAGYGSERDLAWRVCGASDIAGGRAWIGSVTLELNVIQNTSLNHFAVNDAGGAALCRETPVTSPRCRGAGFRSLWGGAPAQQHEWIETHVLQA